MAKDSKPALRFNGFTEAWEQRKLGEITASYSGGTPTVGVKIYYGGTIPFIRSAEINCDSTELFITEEGLEKSSAKLVSEGDILYALYGATSGEVGRAKLNGAINQAILAIKPIENYDAEFITQWLRKNKQSIVETYLQGGQGNLSGEIVKGLIVNLPSYGEQQVIGKYFRCLDRLITLYQRKCNKLMEVKKSMLEKMFPKDGANVPEVRFKGFTEAWNKRKFGEIYDVNNELNDDAYPVEKTISIATMTFNEQGNGAAASSLAKYKVLRIGDIAFEGHTNKEFRYGRFVLNNLGNGIMSPRFTTLRPIVEQDYNFLEYYVHQEKVMKGILVNATKAGTMMNELVPADLFRQYILVPSTKEQMKIGHYFKRLDRLITSNQRKQEKLKNIKNACLEKMFA